MQPKLDKDHRDRTSGAGWRTMPFRGRVVPIAKASLSALVVLACSKSPQVGAGNADSLKRDLELAPVAADQPLNDAAKPAPAAPSAPEAPAPQPKEKAQPAVGARRDRRRARPPLPGRKQRHRWHPSPLPHHCGLLSSRCRSEPGFRLRCKTRSARAETRWGTSWRPALPTTSRIRQAES